MNIITLGRASARLGNYYDFMVVVGVFAMIIDHIGYYFLYDALILRAVGQACLAIWCVTINGSGQKTLSLRMRIILCAVILELFQRFILWLSDGDQLAKPLDFLWSIMFTRCCNYYLFLPLLNKNSRHFYWLLPVMTLTIPVTRMIYDGGALVNMTSLALYYCNFRKMATDRAAVHFAVTFVTIISLVVHGMLFNFGLVENIVLLTSTLAILFIVCHYDPYDRHEIVMEESRTNMLMCLILSRHSIYVYVGHIMLFEFLQYKMYY